MSTHTIWECLICGWVYDEAKGWPEDGIAAGTRWEDVPEDWLCPECGVSKADFEMAERPAEETLLASPRAADQDVMSAAIPAEATSYKLWECVVCGWVYDEAKGWPEDGIAPGTRWEDVPEDWLCPDCGVGKGDFEMIALDTSSPVTGTTTPPTDNSPIINDIPAIDYNRKPVVIVGTGLAGYNLAREFRRLDQLTPLILISRDDGRFYSKPLISTGFHKGKSADQMATASAEDMAQQLSAEVHIFTDVTRIDREHRVLHTTTGSIAYDKLVLATGAGCIEAPLTGNAVNEVYSINDLLDYTRFRTATVGKKRVLIIGAGLIGSEYANDLVQAGFQVHVVDPLNAVLGTLLPPTASAAVQQSLSDNGVRFHLATVVQCIDRTAEGLTATLGNGETLQVDMVLSAIGVRPNLTLAETCGLATHRGIVTDRHLQTSDPHIYALGDCAEVDGHVLFYIAPLMECARKLAQTLNGNASEVYYGRMPVTVKTTLHPVVVAPPARGTQGEWQLDRESASGVRAIFLNDKEQVCGFALTGDCVGDKDQLTQQLLPIMS
ncbi:FAD-dependent oxidoreductase [Aestuariicella hydrocarbonica]|uniref:FAD-dependent oxidoreductase n=1 Tax=Pseudomaricurvus hydrocarbonicus TaxID=1470433 RepID=A0A9E5JVK9_9GAMM|nr:FAD-dependent oxidoreductase [Aestuariicella hydrocarbonica]NHO66049.1 FAD-dependent oxidoreductase [Aestuariicella hydrocarbonica]